MYATFVVISAVAIAAELGERPEQGEIETDDINPAVFQNAVAADALSLNGLLPPASGFDWDVTAFSSGDGRVCVLHFEGFALRSLTSVDGGETFAPEVDVAGTGEDPDVLGYRAVIGTDDRIHVALIVADPGGGPGLRYTHSDDLGTTWAPLTTLVSDGVSSFALYKWDLAISANGTGVVAISYTSDETGGVHLAYSVDGGSSWPEVAHRVDLAGDSPFTFYGDSAVLADSSGNIHVAYTQNRGPFTRMYVRRRSSTGAWTAEGPTSSVTGPEIYFGHRTITGDELYGDGRLTDDPGVSATPRVAWNAAFADFAVTWNDDRDGNSEIYFVRRDVDGVPTGDNIRVTNDPAESLAPCIVRGSGSEYAIAWQDARDGNNEIYFARLDHLGNRIGGDVRITDDPGSSTRPSLVWTGARYGLVWQDDRTGDDEIWFALISPTGDQIGADIRVTNDVGTSAAPSLVSTGTSFAVAWQDNRDGNDEIYFTLLNAGGGGTGVNLRVTDDPASSTHPSLVSAGTEFAIAWQDDRDGNAEIYFTRLDSAGNEIGDDARITNEPAASVTPDLAFNGSGYGVAWQDERDGLAEIYFANLDSTGARLGEDVRFNSTDTPSSAPSLVWSASQFGSQYGVAWEDMGGLSLAGSRSPALAQAADGSILVAYWLAGGKIAVIRSESGGIEYEPSLDASAAAADLRRPPRLTAIPETSTLFLSYETLLGNQTLLMSRCSHDNGATFLGETMIGNLRGGGEVPSYDLAKGTGDKWAYVWRSTIDDTYLLQTWDVFLRSSDDDGLTFEPEVRVDSGASGVEWRGDPAIVSTPGEFLVVYPDERGNTPPVDAWSSNIFANRTLESSIGFGQDYRIDTDTGAPPPFSGYQEPTIATDGVDHVYVAFNGYSPGPYATIFVAASADRGKTFGAPVAIGESAAGQIDSYVPMLAATPDGRVYVVYQADPTDLSGRQLRVNSSSDFGQTWQSSDVLLGSVAQLDVATFGLRGLRVPGPSLAALPGGKFWVVWTNRDELLLSRSVDGGLTFVTEDIDQNTLDEEVAPSMCVHGDRVIVVWQGENSLFNTSWTIWALVSNDGGATFQPRYLLRPGQSSYGYDPRIACNGDGGAVVVWSDLRDDNRDLWWSRYDGSAWSTGAKIPGPPDVPLYYQRLAFTDSSLGDPTNLLLVYEASPGVYLNRSTDGGATFSPYVRLDAAAPEPDNRSYWPRVAADGSNNVWVNWLDYSANRSVPSMALRRSTDGGASFDPAIRVDRKVPGSLYNSYYFNTETAALPETGLFAWYAQNGAGTAGNLFLADDRSDDDSDGVNGSLDCDDDDPDVHPGAPQLCDGVNNDCNDESWPEVPAGEADVDGDGVRICQGDCDDVNPDTFPDAPEVNDGEDNQCSGNEGYGLVDETSGESGFHNPADRDEYSWTAQPGATEYEIARSGVPDFSTDCVTMTTSSTWWVDTEQPVEGGVFYYLNRPIAPYVGSWGRYSWGVERTTICP